MDRRQYTNSQELSEYISRISPILTSKELANYADTSYYSVRRWQGDKNTGTNSETTRSLGVLAATLDFLETELSFSQEDTRIFLKRVHIDSDTGEPVSALDQIKTGDTPQVISDAIELSITE